MCGKVRRPTGYVAFFDSLDADGLPPEPAHDGRRRLAVLGAGLAGLLLLFLA